MLPDSPVLFLSLTYCFLRQPTCVGMQQKYFKYISYLSHRILKRYVLQSWDLIKLIIFSFIKGHSKVKLAFLFCFELHVVVTVHRVPSYGLDSSRGTGSVTKDCFSIISTDVIIIEKINNILVLLLREFFLWATLEMVWGPPEVCGPPYENSCKRYTTWKYGKQIDFREKIVAISKSAMGVFFCLRIYHIEQADSW